MGAFDPNTKDKLSAVGAADSQTGQRADNGIRMVRGSVATLVSCRFRYMFGHLPTIGVGIGVLALASVVMTVRAENFQSRKDGLDFIGVALVIIRIQAIRAEQEKHEQEQSAMRLDERSQFAKSTLRQSETIRSRNGKTGKSPQH